jgi:3-isopropylmalate/(R)-2-methylmalate dehydratase small subunit
MDKYTAFNSKIVALPNENVDTDQIIPARFLKVTTTPTAARNPISS